MNILEDLFFFTGPGVQVLYRMGFIPKAEDFREMTEDEYQEFLEQYPEGKGEKMFIIMHGETLSDSGNKICVTDIERIQLLRAAAHLDNLAHGEVFENDEQKLSRLARALPPVFTKGSRFERTDVKTDAE